MAASSQAAHYRSQLAEVEERVIQSTSIARNPIIGSIESRISDLELERAQQATTRGPEHAEIKKLDEQIAANDRARQANERLNSEVHDLKEGLDMVEEKARSELGMVKPNEVYVHYMPR